MPVSVVHVCCALCRLVSMVSDYHVSVLFVGYIFFFFKQKTAYEMRISDWSSDVCSSDLGFSVAGPQRVGARKIARGNRCIVVVQHGDRVRRRWFAWRRFDRQVVGHEHQFRFGFRRRADGARAGLIGDRKGVVWGRRVSVRVALGGRRTTKKNTKTKSTT